MNGKEPKTKHQEAKYCWICGDRVIMSESFGFDPEKGYHHTDCYYEYVKENANRRIKKPSEIFG